MTIMILLLFFSFTGIANIKGYNYFPVSVFLEVGLVFIAVVNTRKISKKIVPLFIFMIVYIVGSFVYVVLYRALSTLDFLLVYKSIYYIIILSLFKYKIKIRSYYSYKWFLYILCAALVKYAISILILNRYRPGLYYENNYEIPMFILIGYSYIIHSCIHKKVKVIIIIVLLILTLMSGSRSAIVIYVFFYFFSIKEAFFKNNHLVSVLSILLIMSFVFFVFLGRQGGNFDVYRIDRFKFFMSFLYETKDWSVYNYFLGSNRIQQMSDVTAKSLSYYKSLFSYDSVKIAYSVILHSFILRFIFDHGLLMLFVLLYYLKRILKLNSFSNRNIGFILILLLLNGVSVSSLNSIYIVIGLVIMIDINRTTGRL